MAPKLPLGIIKNYAITEELVREFNEKFGHPAPSRPTVLTKEELALRIKLIDEELDEVKRAFESGRMVDILKELCDLQYVVDGLFVASGFDKLKEEGFLLVHTSNMSKLGEDGKPIYRADGKILKGPNYKPVTDDQLKAIIDG